MSDVQFFENENGITAYKQTVTGSDVGVFFLSGHRTTFDNQKRRDITSFCAAHDVSLTHFTYGGWDQSSLKNVPSHGEGYVQDWFDQALNLFDHKTTGKHIIMGSSMGGYMALALAHARPDRVVGVGLMAAGFGKSLTQQIHDHYGENRVGTKTEKGFTYNVNPDGSLPINGTLNIQCPVRLRHSVADEIVSYRNAEYIANAVATDDVIMTLTKFGGHSANDPRDVQWLHNTLRELAL
jgi:dienelactone hydrolase